MQTVLKMARPDITVYSEFLPPTVCHALIVYASEHISKSSVVDPHTGKGIEHEGRTSSGMFFRRGHNPLITAIEERIAAVTGIPVENGEGLQVLRYQEGQQYRPHFDQFDEDNPGTASHLARGGQRIATLLIYLNTPEAGGETTFPNAGVSVSAVQGNVLLFRYPNPEDKPMTLHSGVPVTKGEKWVATKWLRAGEFK